MSGEYYAVDRILDKKIANGEEYYLVQWQGYSTKDATWENIDNLASVLDLIAEFNSRKKLSNSNHIVAPRKRGRPRKKPIYDSDENMDVDQSYEGNSITSKGNDRDLHQSYPKEKLRERGTTKISERVIHADNQHEYSEKNIPNKLGNAVINNDGAVEYDVPNRIVSAKMDERNKIYFLVEWKRRYDGSVPNNTYVENEKVKLLYPSLLIQYYESKITSR